MARPMARWTPKDDGRDFTFSEILKPLTPYRAYINVVSNLGHPLAYGWRLAGHRCWAT